MSIRFQLVVIFIFVIAVLLALGAYAASIYRQNMAATDRIWVHTRNEIMMAYQAKVAFEGQQKAWANFILRGHETDRYHNYLSEFYARERETKQAINALISEYSSDSLHEGERQPAHILAARKFQQDYLVLGRQYRQALKIYNASDDPIIETDRFILGAVNNPTNMIDIMIDHIVNHHHNEVNLVREEVNTALASLWIGAALVLLLSMAGLVWFIYNRIGRPLNTMTTVARHIRDGDIHQRVPTQSEDEFGVLGDTLNSMLNRLEDVNRSLAVKTKELQESNKELESFSYTIAHDLRSPLRAITGFSQILQEDLHGKLDPEHQDVLNRISAAGMRMSDQIEHILDLTRISRNKIDIERIDLSRIAEEIVQEISDSEPERQVEIDIQPGLQVQADAKLLRVVLQNLLENAWKFTRNEVNPSIRLSAGEEDGQTVYRVTDNGAGFNMEYAHKLFGVFERLHSINDYEGAGIGLSSVQRAIQRHGGWIRGESEPGKGAEFVFSLG